MAKIFALSLHLQDDRINRQAISLSGVDPRYLGKGLAGLPVALPKREMRKRPQPRLAIGCSVKPILWNCSAGHCRMRPTRHRGHSSRPSRHGRPDISNSLFLGVIYLLTTNLRLRASRGRGSTNPAVIAVERLMRLRPHPLSCFFSKWFASVRSATHSFKARASRHRSCTSPLVAARTMPPASLRLQASKNSFDQVKYRL